MWEQAYAEIAPNRGVLTRGVTDNTLDGFSLERVHSLISRISSGTYRFTPVRRVYIPKPDGKKLRPLGVRGLEFGPRGRPLYPKRKCLWNSACDRGR